MDGVGDGKGEEWMGTGMGKVVRSGRDLRFGVTSIT